MRRLERAEKNTLKTAATSSSRSLKGKTAESLATQLEAYDKLRVLLGRTQRSERLWGLAVLGVCLAVVVLLWSQRLRQPQAELDVQASVIRLWGAEELSWRGSLGILPEPAPRFSGFSELRVDGGRIEGPYYVEVRGEATLERLRITGPGPITVSGSDGCFSIQGSHLEVEADLATAAGSKLLVDGVSGRSTFALTSSRKLQLLRQAGGELEGELRLCLAEVLRLVGSSPARLQIAEPFPMGPGDELLVPSLLEGSLVLRATGQEILLTDRDKLLLTASERVGAWQSLFALVPGQKGLRLVQQAHYDDITRIRGRFEEDLSPTLMDCLRTDKVSFLLATIATLSGALWGWRQLFIS